MDENAVKRDRRTTVRGKTVAYADFYYFECPHCGERYYANPTTYRFKDADQ